MKRTLEKLMILNQLAGKYLVIKMPELRTEDSELKTDKDWFKKVSYIAEDHNSMPMGLVEEVFSRFLRQLG